MSSQKALNSNFNNGTNWLFGVPAAKNVIYLNEILKQRTLKSISQPGIAQYSPWVCSPRISALNTPLPQTPDLLVTQQQQLKTISNLYSKNSDGDDLSWFGLAKSGFYIDVDIENRPNDIEIFNRSINLVRRNPDLQLLFDGLVSNVVPIKSKSLQRRKKGVGFSAPRARNAIFLSVPDITEFTELELAINIFHEVAHQAIFIYQSADKIIVSDLKAPVYSGIRRCHRPAIMAFHGAVALAAMIHAFQLSKSWPEYSSTDAIDYTNARIKELQLDLAQTLLDLSKCKFTALGSRIYKELIYFLQVK